MMTQKTGALIFDETADRYDIRFDINDYYGGLHCGDCMEVFVRGKWEDAYPYGVRGQLVSCGYSGGRPFRAAGTDLTGRRESGRSFFMPAPLPGGGHTTIEHERKNLVCRRETNEKTIALYIKTGKLTAQQTRKGYESPAYTDEKAA